MIWVDIVYSFTCCFMTTAKKSFTIRAGITCSMSTIKAIEQGVIYCLKSTSKAPEHQGSMI